LIEGSFELLIDGEAPRMLKAGESYKVPPRAVHDAKTGPDGAKVIATYVVEKGPAARISIQVRLCGVLGGQREALSVESRARFWNSAVQRTRRSRIPVKQGECNADR
jgi:hypothetical protein